MSTIEEKLKMKLKLLRSEVNKKYKKEWYQDNKDLIKEKRQERIVCDICGATYCRYSHYTHVKTKKHLNIKSLREYMAKNNLELPANY